MKKNGSKKIIYPDWSRTAGQVITCADENVMNPRPVWKPFDLDSPDDTTRERLHRCVTLEITGGSTLFEKFESDEEKHAVWLERSREVTWRRALGFAEQMWREATHCAYVVLFRPVSQDNGHETVCIYRLQRIPEL